MSQLTIPEAATFFVAYGSTPPAIGETLEAGARIAREAGLKVETWRQMDVPGRFLLEKVIAHIDKAQVIAADITRLNFNVVFEIGYALGTGKRVLPVVNTTLNPQHREIGELGLFDTLGWTPYENAVQFAHKLQATDDTTSISPAAFEVNRLAPVYVLDTLHKRDATVHTISRIRRAGLKFRSFDPKEQPRLSALEAYKDVGTSAGVVAHLLSNESTDHLLNNLRAAFVAGLAYGMDREILLLQEGGSPVPLDYRDLVASYGRIGEIDEHVNGFAPRVTQALQKQTLPTQKRQNENLLSKLDFGAPAAENEVSQLTRYYMETDEFRQVLSGSTRLVVGRKGSGKSALFFHAQDTLCGDPHVVTCDLKPEGHQFKRFKELVLEYLGNAAAEHVVAGFWEYVLLLELARKLLELDEKLHLRNHRLFDPYRTLSELHAEDRESGAGDFSHRILILVERLVEAMGSTRGDNAGKLLDGPTVTARLYQQDVRTLRDSVADYLQARESEAWILLDNIDKGWPTRGVESQDITILRGLLEASRKIARALSKKEVDVRAVIFLRNDVHELLVEQTPDHGKESRVSLDWTDVDLMKEMVRRRVCYNLPELREQDFDTTWNTVCDSHLHGEATENLMIERSLMRPRNLINLMVKARGNAVNLGHPKILATDIEKALKANSDDLSTELGLEIRDVFPEGSDVMYEFLGAPGTLTLADVYARLRASAIDTDRHTRCVELLLWFCFLGVARPGSPDPDDVHYAYSVQYDMKKLLKLARNLTDPNVKLRIHRAFWPFLDIAP